MRASAKASLCSWEIPYDFTPRIHPYRGVDRGVVQEAWTRRDADAPRPRRIQWKLKQPKRSKRAGRTSSSTPPVAAGAAAAAQQQTALPPQQQRPRVPRPPAAARGRGRGATAPAAAPPPATRLAFHVEAREDDPRLQELSRRDALHQPPRAPAPPRGRFTFRTAPAYSLSPQHAQRRRWLRSHSSVDVGYDDTHSSRHSPPSQHAARLPHRHRQRLRTNTVEALAAQLHAVAPWSGAAEAVREAASAAAPDSDGTLLDVYAATHSDRLGALEAHEGRVYDRLVEGVVRIAALAVDTPTGPVLAAPALLDSGHVGSPIHFTGRGSDAAGEVADSCDGDGRCSPAPVAVAEDAVAVLVRPIEHEVQWCAPHAPHRPPEAPPCLLPRGREWARQAAVREAVGATAQEALIDLGLDERYRQPGEYVRWRHDRGQRRAVR